MGRYDFPSEGSRSGFFSNGVMYAALNCVGNTPDDSDLMNDGDEWRQHIHIVFEKMRWKWIGGALLGRKLADGVNDVINV